MAKTTQTPAEAQTSIEAVAPAPVAEQTTAPELTLTVNEFCRRKSEKLNRTELISAFYAAEVSQGRTKDTATAFEARFQTFINKPA